jgi:acetoin utilization protein AcuB
LSVADLLSAFWRACATARAVDGLDAVVASRMSEAPFTIESKASAADALQVCRLHGVRHLPVMDDGWFVGLVSDRDLRLCAGRGELERRVGEIMSTDLAMLGPESLLSDAADLMQRRNVESIPVTREGRLVGILTTADLLEHLREKLASVAARTRAKSV